MMPLLISLAESATTRGQSFKTDIEITTSELAVIDCRWDYVSQTYCSRVHDMDRDREVWVRRWLCSGLHITQDIWLLRVLLRRVLLGSIPVDDRIGRLSDA
jgi:hypothetical protein